MARKRNSQRSRPNGTLLTGNFRRDLTVRRRLSIELPEFLICALEFRVDVANAGAPVEERSTLQDCIESELVNLITVRDVAELEMHHPGFAAAVTKWLDEVR